MSAAHGARAVTGRALGAHSPAGPASQGRWRMIRGGRGGCDTQLRLGSRLQEQTAPPRSMGQRPRAPPSGGGVAGGLTGHLLAQGSGEFPKAPLR